MAKVGKGNTPPRNPGASGDGTSGSGTPKAFSHESLAQHAEQQRRATPGKGGPTKSEHSALEQGLVGRTARPSGVGHFNQGSNAAARKDAELNVSYVKLESIEKEGRYQTEKKNDRGEFVTTWIDVPDPIKVATGRLMRAYRGTGPVDVVQTRNEDGKLVLQAQFAPTERPVNQKVSELSNLVPNINADPNSPAMIGLRVGQPAIDDGLALCEEITIMLEAYFSRPRQQITPRSLLSVIQGMNGFFVAAAAFKDRGGVPFVEGHPIIALGPEALAQILAHFNNVRVTFSYDQIVADAREMLIIAADQAAAQATPEKRNEHAIAVGKRVMQALTMLASVGEVKVDDGHEKVELTADPFTSTSASFTGIHQFIARHFVAKAMSVMSQSGVAVSKEKALESGGRDLEKFINDLDLTARRSTLRFVVDDIREGVYTPEEEPTPPPRRSGRSLAGVVE